MKPKTAGKNNKKSRPIFARVLFPVCILVIVESILLAGSVFGGGLTAQLNQNARDILGERVLNRKNYLENEMINSWSRIGLTVQSVNKKVEQLIQQDGISIHTIDSDFERSEKLLTAVSGDLISLIRSNRTTGVFLVLNNQDLEADEAAGRLRDKPGLYLRDLDPVSQPSDANTDLLFERGPSSVAQALNLSMDSGWRPQFEFSERADDKYYEFLSKPYQEAAANRDQDLGYLDFGYWSGPFILYGDGREAITYSVPLILNDGTVYGVMGIDLTTDHLRKIIPYEEVADDKRGAYILAVSQGGKPVFDNVYINGPIFKQTESTQGVTELSLEEEGFVFREGMDDFYCSVEYLNVYNSNAPFSGQRWALIGVVRERDLYSFTENITRSLLAAIFFTLLAGVAGSLLVSKMVARPVAALMKDIGGINRRKAISLRRTGILEIDSLEASIEELSSDVIDAAAKFTQIIELASVRIAGFEIMRDSQSLFITDGFFELFRLENVDTKGLDIKTFQCIMTDMGRYINREERRENEVIFSIASGTSTAFIKLKFADDGERCIGLAEDVTQAVRERDMIAHERDHDTLTGLWNRGAFGRRMKRLFEQERESLKTAALVMLDLDNLKQLNDTYGHECGDRYIQCAAACFLSAVPEGTIVSRNSGDEFYLFFYGYEGKEEIRELLSRLSQAIREKTFQMPGQVEQKIMASGGIVWYPEDSQDYGELLRFSDFAMYKVKQSQKGEMREFDIGVYNKEAYLLQSKAELAELINNSLVQYHFQPIVSARTGELFAYEALMRANMPTLHTAMEIIELARRESKLDQIERITWFCALGTYADLVEAGKIDRECRVFINSIASEVMSGEEISELERRYADWLDRIVLELTEDERMNEQGMLIKKNLIRRWNAELALDDYGSGYNSERMLLALSPKYIKIDLSLIRNIHNDPDKQKIVENIISYGCERGMRTIAEGVETREEAAKMAAMGVDYLQGYWIARPNSEPPVIGEDIRRDIAAMNKGIKIGS